MNHQPITLWLPFVFVVACGGGSGTAISLEDGEPASPDQIPPNSDQIIIADPPPNNEVQPPPPPGDLPGGSTGGDSGGNGGNGPCNRACDMTVERGCTTPVETCRQICDAPVEICQSEQRALITCALGVFCPEDLTTVDATETQLLATACLSQVMNYNECQATAEQ